MRLRPLAAAVLLAAGLTNAGPAAAVVVVRHPVYHPVHPVAAVATVAVVVAIVSKPPPATPPPPPSAPPPPPVTTPLPMDATMWQLPSGCLKMTVSGQIYYQCGPSWLAPQKCDQGPYYQVVPSPQAPPPAPPK